MRVVLTRPLFDDDIDRLTKMGLEVVVRRSPFPPTEEELLRLGKCDVLITMLTDPITRRVLAGLSPRLVAQCAVGYDNIDTDAARELGVVVTNTPGVLSAAVADLTWALILAWARRIPEADAYARMGRWRAWSLELFLGVELSGETIGILGAGRIGREVARRALGFGMEVLYYSRKSEMPFGQKVSLEELLGKSLVVSLHVPLTPDTRHMIGEAQLRMMRRDALLVNTARGPVVDQRALVRALVEGWIAGAALDVFEGEPEIPRELRELPNVILAPHIGSATKRTRRAMSRRVVENVLAFLEGREPPDRVV